MALPAVPCLAMERIRVADDHRGFVFADSGKPFVPWGFNYGNAGRLMEDFWETDWQTLVDDLAEMKALGGNVTRIHLQFNKFMDAADKPNAANLARLKKLLDAAEKTGIYLDLTGLACYRTKDVPAWYDALDEKARWAAQANFWAAIAETCKDSPAVFCYDLINEPLVAGDERKPGQWYSGKTLGEYDFLQFITLDKPTRPRDQIAKDWIHQLVAAIRKHDRTRMVTVGMLPTIPGWGYFSGFVPATLAPELDYISVHIYPEKGKVPQAMETLKQFAVAGKPLVIEETFPLSCSSAELKEFLLQSRSLACGWVLHYDGSTPKDYEELQKAGKLTLSQGIWNEALKLMVEVHPQMQPQPSTQPATQPAR